jgi:RND superfamily putative drug exporter
LTERLPDSLAKAGLTDVTASFAGDTAISSQVSHMALDDTLRVGALVIVLELALLLLFLRSLLAPPLLLAITVLLVLGALGLATTVSSAILGQESLSFLVPIATMVLLLSLGADYNLFLVGKVWAARRSQRFQTALEKAAAESSSTILTAGLALTASFAILFVVPLASFRQIAIALSIGLLADTLIVRPFLVPAALSTLGRLATWPSMHEAPEEAESGPVPEAVAAGPAPDRPTSPGEHDLAEEAKAGPAPDRPTRPDEYDLPKEAESRPAPERPTRPDDPMSSPT